MGFSDILGVLESTVVVLVSAVIRLLSKLWSRLLRAVSFFLPVKITSSPLKRGDQRLPRVAVIGGGIAGVGAAWSLKKSGKFSDVTIFEPRDVLGGNAKTYLWDVASVGQVRTGLSVLAWPKAYFKHYELLLQELRLPTEVVVPKFYVSKDGAQPTFRHGEDHPEWQRDQKRWDSAVEFIRKTNAFFFTISERISKILRLVGLLSASSTGNSSFSKASAPSLYEVTILNPMNVIPARWFCRVVFGVSNAFWLEVVVPVYSSSFLTTRLDGLPCVILPALDDIISVGDKHRLRELNTWRGSSKDVFDAMAATIGRTDVLTGVAVTSAVFDAKRGHWKLEYQPQHDAAAEIVRDRLQQGSSLNVGGTLIHRRNGEVQSVMASTDSGDNAFLYPRHDTASVPATSDRRICFVEEWFDFVVFACPASAVDSLTNDERNRTSGFRSSLFEAILPNVLYENERDDNFTTGYVHRNRQLAVPNPAMRAEFFKKRFTNYIELHGDAQHGDLENSFVLGTWVPTAVRAAAAASVGAQSTVTSNSATIVEDGVCNMIVTYHAVDKKERDVKAESLLPVDNSWAHPQFTLQSLALSMALPLLQGERNAYYCGSYATPGNGHDLSLLSGLIVAEKLSGGYYPFSATADVSAKRDFELLKKMLLY